jgi:hypothetical protein
MTLFTWDVICFFALLALGLWILGLPARRE